MISHNHRNPPSSSRRTRFARDLAAFLHERGTPPQKLPIIGGGNLDLFKLMYEVLLLGGVENVVNKRAFRIVAQQLQLPKTCTSAAYVLKGAYEKMLYAYEMSLVHGKLEPADLRLPERERDAPRGRKRLRDRPMHHVDVHPSVVTILSTISHHPDTTLAYLQIVIAETATLIMPTWAVHTLHADGWPGLLDNIFILHQQRRVTSAAEVVLLAVAESFMLPDTTNTRQTDLGLCKALCLLPAPAQCTRRAQAYLFCLVIAAVEQGLILSDTRSARAFVDGLFTLLKLYQLHQHATPFLEEKPVNRDAAAAYCVVRILANLAQTPANRHPIFTHSAMAKVFFPLLTTLDIPRDFCISMLDLLASLTELDEWPVCTIDLLFQAVVIQLDASTCMDTDTSLPDYDISTRALTILVNTSSQITLESSILSPLVALICTLLHSQHTISHTAALAHLCNMLCTRFLEIVANDSSFILGLFSLVKDAQCTSIAADCLQSLNGITPLNEYATEAGLKWRGDSVDDLLGTGIDMFLNGLPPDVGKLDDLGEFLEV